jgi:hypothetical protein
MLNEDWRRWAAAERDDREEEADAALRRAFRDVPRAAPADQFSARVAQAVSTAVAREARLARAVLAGSGVAALLMLAALVTLAPRLFPPMLDAGVGGLVWTLAAVDNGFSVWTVLAQFARAVATLLVAPQVTLVLMALALVAIGALYGLNRMLELEERSSS